MPELRCEISQSLMNALLTREQTTGEPLAHIVMRALADQLEVPHATLFQMSTSGALIEGISQGIVTVGELKRHGDLGLGTFADLDGEMVAVDGRFWRVPGSGSVQEAADSDLAPFAVVTNFRPSDASTWQALFQLMTSRANSTDCALRIICSSPSVSMVVSLTRIRGQYARRNGESGSSTPLPARRSLTFLP